MIGGDPVWLLRPWWLLALPVIGLLTAWQWHRTPEEGAWSRVIDPALLAAMREIGQMAKGGSVALRLAPLAAAAGVAVALAGPAIQRKGAPALRNLDEVMIVMDLSPSMTQGGSLDDAQAAAAALLHGAAGRPVGLMLYAGEPYLIGPASDDPATLETPISVLDAETLPVRGSRPDRAIAAVRERLGAAGIRTADIVLITDGGGIGDGAIREATRVRDVGGKLSAVLVEPDRGAATQGVPFADAEALGRLVAAGGGVLTDAHDTEAVSRHLAARRSGLAEDASLSALLLHDIGRWLLMLAMVPALALWRRGS
ncbi:VWA domain-containing protein [Limibaculum sp. M0105]|uniref:VWA domain-containing protein n=1 Tax=Thermohalobaculum xanthum TaxID=2753746 RepID=A0A8J7M4I0_9RHOB|nr:VWA domain-containing protein [Thermohalobaculum xanthum]MBK0398181.1 VWA domain-containing protein [Thermohalobaculum xanthum]